LKKLNLLFLIFFSSTILRAQHQVRDSLEALLSTERTDSGRIGILTKIGNEISYSSDKDSATWYYRAALDLAKKTNDTKAEIKIQLYLAETFYYTGNMPQALSISLRQIKRTEEFKDTSTLFYFYRLVGWIYSDMGDNKTAFDYVKKMSELVKSGFFKDDLYQTYHQITNASFSMVYSGLKQLDSALYFQYLIYEYAVFVKDQQFLVLSPYWIASTYSEMGKTDSAFYYFRKAMSNAKNTSRADIPPACKLGIAELYFKINQTDSSFFYARQSMTEFIRNGDYASLLDVYALLSKLHQRTGRYDSAYLYQQRYNEKKDSLFNQKKMSEVQNMAFNETLLEQQLNQAKKEAQLQYRSKIRTYILVAIISAILIISFLLMRNLQTKKRANSLLEKQKEEIERQKNNVENTLVELKLTQSQLIQSEKMASLGELTAGIAHEIQNPLNFMNNFSEVNKELIEEIKQELTNGNISEAIIIADNIHQNEDKINHHGKRADAIIKGMLQHSQSSAGKKEPTDLNALTDEYLKLAFHGYRVKEKSFSVMMNKNYDETIGKINIISQEMGRVLLNLFNNAFYAVSDKKKQSPEGYEPAISINTKRVGGRVEIRIRDNGNGIPQKVIDKIFQPFFTTKSTGQGTGLGLSLSYDIIKAHGGDIKVETKEGEFAEFMVQIPAV
jgi:two-component system, NtrC family, sensor kinase